VPYAASAAADEYGEQDDDATAQQPDAVSALLEVEQCKTNSGEQKRGNRQNDGVRCIATSFV